MVTSANFIRGMVFEGTGLALKYPSMEDGALNKKQADC